MEIYDVLVPPALEHAMAQQQKQVPDDAAVIERLYKFLKQSRPKMAEILASICEFYEITEIELLGRRRERETALARQIYYTFVHRYTRLSMKQIAERLKRDPSTVQHGIRRIEKYVVTSPLIREDLELLRMRICEKMLQRPLRITPC